MEPWFFELRWISFQKGGFFLFVFFSKALLEYKRSVDKRKTMMWVSFKTWVIMMSFVGDGYKQSFWSYARRSLWGENNSRNRTLFSSVGVFQIAWKFTLSTFKKLNVSLLIFSLCCDPLKFFTREKCLSMLLHGDSSTIVTFLRPEFRIIDKENLYMIILFCNHGNPTYPLRFVFGQR